MKVENVNAGQYIEYEVEGTRIYFGDDELMINLKRYQGDEERTIDITKTRRNTLAIGADSGFRYVAQVVIPPKEYEYSTVAKDGSENEVETIRTAKDINMDNVTLKLFAI